MTPHLAVQSRRSGAPLHTAQLLAEPSASALFDEWKRRSLDLQDAPPADDAAFDRASREIGAIEEAALNIRAETLDDMLRKVAMALHPAEVEPGTPEDALMREAWTCLGLPIERFI